MKRFLLIPLFFTGCMGGDGDDRTALEFTSSCVFGDATQSCAELGFGDFTPEGESNDFELHCEEQSNGITIVCGPNIQIDAAIQNGDNPNLADFLSKNARIPNAPDASELPDS